MHSLLGLNNITIKNRYPLPLVFTDFELLNSAKIFIKPHRDTAYHLVRLKDEWKTAFNTPSGHYKYSAMRFELSNASTVCQRLVDDVLRELLNAFCPIYIYFRAGT